MKYKEVILSAKGQITVPKKIRETLGVDYGDPIAFYVDEKTNEIKMSSPKNMNIKAKNEKKQATIKKGDK